VVKKTAFTLIELVFAIVIIGFTVLSLPMMNRVISQGIESNLVQEAIFASSAELNEAITAYWDDNSLDANTTFARVIDDGNCSNISSSSRYRLKPGHIAQPLHRRCVDSNDTSFPDVNNSAVFSLDDIAHGSKNIFIDATTNQTGYKKDYNSTLIVERNTTFDGTNNPNIKKLTITVTDTKGKPITKLSTYSANIGEIDYYKRSF